LAVYVEFSRPGFVLPGVLGATLTLIALSALTRFPFTLPGALLIVFALCLFVLEALFATRGILMVAGIAAMVEGALRLIDTPEPALRIHPNVALAVTVPFSFITTFLLSIAFRARRNKVAQRAGKK
jgi:membrane-bound serine protease (ClpP class)